MNRQDDLSKHHEFEWFESGIMRQVLFMFLWTNQHNKPQIIYWVIDITLYSVSIVYFSAHNNFDNLY